MEGISDFEIRISDLGARHCGQYHRAGTAELELRDSAAAAIGTPGQQKSEIRNPKSEITVISLCLKTLGSNRKSLPCCQFQRGSGFPMTPGCGAARGCTRLNRTGS